jgi:hypothetical protein
VLFRATNFVGASTAVTAAPVDSVADGSADALGSADCEISGAGAAASSPSVPADFDQTIATRIAIPITTIHAVRFEVDAFGAATGLGATIGAGDLGAATTAAGADVTRVVVAFLTTRFAGAFFAVFLATFFATAFFAVFFATRLVAVFLAEDFLTVFFAVFFATAFLATAFLVVFFFATAFLAGDFFAAVFFAGDFFAAFFAVFLTATSNSLDCYKHVINAL